MPVRTQLAPSFGLPHRLGRGCGSSPLSTIRVSGSARSPACGGGDAPFWPTPAGGVVEIGAGTGLQCCAIPRRDRRAHPHRTRCLDAPTTPAPPPSATGGSPRIVDAPAERLPLDDGSVDTVVSTLVLCTVDDPERTLSEITRVLRQDGALLFVEHVRANSRSLAACQDYLFRPWRAFAGGCCCNRRTVEMMRACPFSVDAEDAVWRGMPAIVGPIVMGRAIRRTLDRGIARPELARDRNNPGRSSRPAASGHRSR